MCEDLKVDGREQPVTGASEVRLGAAPTIRVATKAIIIQNDALLVTVNSGDFPTFYLCPGGGQQHSEDAHQALRRECLEEIGCGVDVGDLAFVRDYIGADHEFAERDGWVHQQEICFFCSLLSNAEPILGSVRDTWQTGVAWLPLKGLLHEPLWPKALASWLLLPPEVSHPRYLGNVN